jgi:hypothetical protein
MRLNIIGFRCQPRRRAKNGRSNRKRNSDENLCQAEFFTQCLGNLRNNPEGLFNCFLAVWVNLNAAAAAKRKYP